MDNNDNKQELKYKVLTYATVGHRIRDGPSFESKQIGVMPIDSIIFANSNKIKGECEETKNSEFLVLTSKSLKEFGDPNEFNDETIGYSLYSHGEDIFFIDIN